MERISTYEEYLSTDLALTMEEMNNLHSQMKAEINGEEIGLELYEDLLEQAIKYSGYRSKWFLWSREERMEQDAYRTGCHNALISKFDILARYLRKQGKSVAWREVLGDVETNSYVRKRIGDFACYLVFVEAVNAR